MTRNEYYIGLDDTDAGDSVGTGALARELSTHLARELGVRPIGITRHQLLVHPDIPYTSHNSAACVAIHSDARLDELAATCREFVRFLFHPGADPGLCVVEPHRVARDCVEFGRQAQRQVVEKRRALDLAAAHDILLEEHGGTGLGVIGALSACALRSCGDDGRFIAHRGIRDAREEMTAREIVAETAVEMVVDEQEVELKPDATVVTNDWIRPDLSGGRVVLRVRPLGQEHRYQTSKKKPGADDI
jgi:hypothetical protein